VGPHTPNSYPSTAVLKGLGDAGDRLGPDLGGRMVGGAINNVTWRTLHSPWREYHPTGGATLCLIAKREELRA
jgi:hypothetical protein